MADSNISARKLDGRLLLLHELGAGVGEFFGSLVLHSPWGTAIGGAHGHSSSR